MENTAIHGLPKTLDDLLNHPGGNPVSYTHLWDENAKYLKSIRESKNGSGFDDIGMGAAYAYSTMYQNCLLYTSQQNN